MSTRERRLDRARRSVRRFLLTIGEELLEARLQAGMTQRALGAVVSLSASEISRIEHGQAPHVAYETLALLGAALGLDLPLRLYPNGERVRDAAQLALIARFRVHLPASLRVQAEVPLGILGDRRAWDLVVTARGWSIPVEAETQIRDIQALLRRIALKARDGGSDRVLLVVADSRHNRHVLRLAADEFAHAYPEPGRRALLSLKAGECPTASAVILC
jgi:transcriptional regulator with XRE-family HTH domain